LQKKKIIIAAAVLAIFAAIITYLALTGARGNQEDAGNYREFVLTSETGQNISITLTENISGTEQVGAFTASGFLIFLLIFVFIFVMAKNFGKNGSRVMAMDVKDAEEEGLANVRFNDIAGNDEAKESVGDIIDFIRKPAHYAKYGARMPRGMIFYGPPGTGKTLMAKAIAGEAGVKFFAVSGSDFVQMYVGVGAKRVRSLFKKAREAERAVIFIDEIDALAKKRSAQPAGGSDERDQTLNALLTEMSGFTDNDGVIVIAATNRLDTLDEAILRPGRFDRHVEIGLPDLYGRERILELHAKNKPISKDIDFHELAKQTVYFSGAMLENLMNEAAITAARKGIEKIDSCMLDEAYYTIIAGKAKIDRGHNGREQERKIAAFHEAGHALAAKKLCPENTVAKVTIIPSTKGTGGFCLNIPPDKMFFTKEEIEAQIMVNLAGRAAEELAFGKGNITTGASNDIVQADRLSYDYIKKYGMSETVGLVSMSEDKNREEQAKLLAGLYEKTKDMLLVHFKALTDISNALLVYESIDENTLCKYM